jgi:hypothetical protein
MEKNKKEKGKVKERRCLYYLGHFVVQQQQYLRLTIKLFDVLKHILGRTCGLLLPCELSSYTGRRTCCPSAGPPNVHVTWAR